MKKPAIEKIYCLLEKETAASDALVGLLQGVFPYANVNANIYLVMDQPLETEAQVERMDPIFGAIHKHLETFLFTRLFVHLVHPFSPFAPRETMACYEHLKQHTRPFEQEGYMHQEVPRLMLLPLITVDHTVDWQGLASFFMSLRQQFLPPSLFVGGTPQAADMDRLETVGAEKIYWGTADPGKIPQLLSCLIGQDVVDDSSSRLAAAMPVNVPCPQGLILSAKDGRIFPCLDAYGKDKPLAAMDEGFDVPSLMQNYQQWWNSNRICAYCREGLALSFSALPVSQETKHEIGALLYHFGTQHEEQGKLDSAIKSYQASSGLSPASEADAVHFRLGLCYTMQGHYDEALITFKKAEAAYAQEHFLHFYMGLCLFYLGDYMGAVEKFSAAETLAPPGEDLVQILIYEGTCLNYLGQYKKALQPLTKARDMAPQVKEVWSTLGFSYFQLKDFDAAITHLKEAVALDPLSAVDFASLGANYREKGDIPKAIAMFEQALSLDPAMSAAKENLEKLGQAS